MGLISFVRDYFRLADAAAAERRERAAPRPGPVPAPTTAPARTPVARPREPRIRVATVDEAALRVLDLRRLDAVRTRIRGSAYVLKDAERAEFGGTEYLLVREPENGADPQAVAVYGRGRRVGYLSSAKAAAIAPMLDGDSEHDAFRVGGAPDAGDGMRLWIDLPRLPTLRSALRT